MATSLIPHSFVLADLFDVASMSLDVPDYVLEKDPQLEWVTCPTCGGEKWIKSTGSAFGNACRADQLVFISGF